MKKSLVVVALAGAMAFTAASAETVLYGSVRLGAEVAKNHYGAINENGISTKNKRGLAMDDYGSRLGLKGSEDLGNGTKVLFQLEWGFNGMEAGQNGNGFANRLAWLGLQGEWGTIALGRQNNPFTESLNAGTEADEFNGNGVTSALRYATGAVVASAAGVQAGPVDLGNGDVGLAGLSSMPTRVGNSIAYVSPSFNGFNFVVAGIAEAPEGPYNAFGGQYEVNNSSKGFDMYTLGLNYEHESGFYAKAAYMGANLSKAEKTANVYGLNVGFANEQFGVNADFGAGSKGAKSITPVAGHATLRSDKVTSTGWDLGGHFSFGPDYFSTIRATVGQAEVKYKGENNTDKYKLTTWAVGFEQKLSTRTKVWVEYAKTNNKWKPGAANTENVKVNNDVIGVGLRHDF